MVEIPLFYQWVVERLQEETLDGEIEVSKARYLIGTRFKLNRGRVSAVLKELMEMRAIEFDDVKTIKITKISAKPSQNQVERMVRKLSSY